MNFFNIKIKKYLVNSVNQRTIMGQMNGSKFFDYNHSLSLMRESQDFEKFVNVKNSSFWALSSERLIYRWWIKIGYGFIHTFFSGVSHAAVKLIARKEGCSKLYWKAVLKNAIRQSLHNFCCKLLLLTLQSGESIKQVILSHVSVKKCKFLNEMQSFIAFNTRSNLTRA